MEKKQLQVLLHRWDMQLGLFWNSVFFTTISQMSDRVMMIVELYPSSIIYTVWSKDEKESTPCSSGLSVEIKESCKISYSSKKD